MGEQVLLAIGRMISFLFSRAMFAAMVLVSIFLLWGLAVHTEEYFNVTVPTSQVRVVKFSTNSNMLKAVVSAAWIVKNADKKGTPEFEKMAAAYRKARSALPTNRSGGSVPKADLPACPDAANPVELGFWNGSARKVLKIDFTFHAYYPGHSTDLIGEDNSRTDDLIREPGTGSGTCWAFPALKDENISPASVELKLRIVSVEFAD